MTIKQQGFSLLEVTITLAIVGILAATAYHSYASYILWARRRDGQVALLDLTTRLERFFTENNTYVGATLANLNAGTTSPEGHYSLQITSTATNSFSVSATPLGTQASQDAACGTLIFNSLGQKTSSGPSTDCW